jgi:hypothetical protein
MNQTDALKRLEELIARVRVGRRESGHRHPNMIEREYLYHRRLTDQRELHNRQMAITDKMSDSALHDRRRLDRVPRTIRTLSVRSTTDRSGRHPTLCGQGNIVR